MGAELGQAVWPNDLLQRQPEKCVAGGLRSEGFDRCAPSLAKAFDLRGYFSRVGKEPPVTMGRGGQQLLCSESSAASTPGRTGLAERKPRQARSWVREGELFLREPRLWGRSFSWTRCTLRLYNDHVSAVKPSGEVLNFPLERSTLKSSRQDKPHAFCLHNVNDPSVDERPKIVFAADSIEDCGVWMRAINEKMTRCGALTMLYCNLV